jgi:hypothetical protein
VNLPPPFRPYDPEKDREAAHRIWREVGWLEKGKEEWMDRYVTSGRALVAEMEGEAECLVLTAPGTLRYLEEDLPFSCVTGVTTSRVARKQGFAGRLTALAVAVDAREGALVSGLGMFEQGFYNRLGFGTGGYEHWISFDPAHLKVSTTPRAPRRLTLEDWEQAHAARLARLRGHGGCNLLPAEHTRGEMYEDNAFGLGYYDGPGGELTHYVWLHPHGVESGPYQVPWMVYQTGPQLLELLALLHSLADQVRLVRLREPQGIQLQDLIDRPFQRRAASEKGRFESDMHARAYWQMRICDLPGCLAHTHLTGPELRFNLSLSDPITRLLDADAAWRGIGGEYVVTLGEASSARAGSDPALPTLSATVNAFTRLWLGVRPATGLAVTDDLAGPPELLQALDRAFCLPDPKPDWDF